jgi:hypothetical protein
MISIHHLLLPLLSISTLLHAGTPPACEWVFNGGGSSSDKTRAVAFDKSGHVFLASECTGDSTFGDKQHHSAGGMDMCLVKLDPAGKAQWVSSIGGSKVDRAYGVVADAAGNAYVTGHFESTDVKVNGETLPNAGSYDVFTAKFAPDGRVLWVKTSGGAGYDYGHGIAIDSKGDVVITGAIDRKLFCTKYDSEGKEIWHKVASGTVTGSGHGIAVDGSDHIYLGGNASGAGGFGKAAIESKTTAAIAVKLTPDGEGVWASVIPGTPSALYHEITCDSSGRVWGVGMFKGTVSVAGQTFTSSGDKDNDGLIVHLDKDGQVKWAKHLQGKGTDYCLGVVTDDHGTAFVCGDFNQATSLAGHALTPRGSGDIFLAAFDIDGALQWVEQAGGKLNDNAYPAAFRAPDLLLMGGACVAPAAFGSQEVSKSGASDMYGALWKLPTAQ